MVYFRDSRSPDTGGPPKDLKNDPFWSDGPPGGRGVRILVVTPDFPLWDGGISTVALEWSGGLHRLGHEIVVLTPSQDPGDREFDRKLPYETIRLRNVKARHAKTLYHVWAAIRLCRQRRFDVIVATVWYPSGIAAYCASRLGGVPFVVMVAGNEILHRRFQTPYWMGWMRRVFSGSSANLCISEAVAEKFRAALGGGKDLEKKNPAHSARRRSGTFRHLRSRFLRADPVRPGGKENPSDVGATCGAEGAGQGDRSPSPGEKGDP
ncbi:MAG: glycosyltransferase family 4 protein, partial [Candidatus Deferrimicrobiaceae bacterium]